MGLFDQLTEAAGSLLGGKDGAGNNPLLQMGMQLLSKDSSIGGLAGLVSLFQKNGLGEIVQSWVGTGTNLPISAAQVKQGLGEGLLAQLAGQTGLSADTASEQLARVLPNLVNSLTPEGKIPDSPLLEQGLALLKGALG